MASPDTGFLWPRQTTVALTGQIAADEPNVMARFKGGIGSSPILIAAGALNPATGGFTEVLINSVRGVPGAGPWTIADLTAKVMTDGGIKVTGRGLLQAGGNSIGQSGNQIENATLICVTDEPFVQHSTPLPGVPLDPDGDFRIDDVLNPVPPAECASPVLLIRGNGGVWLAAGIPVPGDDQE